MDSALALIPDGYVIKVQPFELSVFYVLKLYFLRLQVWGDARVIGGNKSTAVTISPIDNHLVLDSSQTLKLHSPMLAVSTCIYSGDDKRISLGANIGGWLDKFIASDEDTWYLAGDAMFLNAVEGDFHLRKKNGKCFSVIILGTKCLEPNLNLFAIIFENKRFDLLK